MAKHLTENEITGQAATHFDNIHWAMDNLRGACAPDNTCQPSCRGISCAG
jgi:hypothetical protein